MSAWSLSLARVRVPLKYVIRILGVPHSWLIFELCMGCSGCYGIMPGKLAQISLRPSCWPDFQKDSKLALPQNVKKFVALQASRQVFRLLLQKVDLGF